MMNRLISRIVAKLPPSKYPVKPLTVDKRNDDMPLLLLWMAAISNEKKANHSIQYDRPEENHCDDDD